MTTEKIEKGAVIIKDFVQPSTTIVTSTAHTVQLRYVLFLLTSPATRTDESRCGGLFWAVIRRSLSKTFIPSALKEQATKPTNIG
jgi:hypothetical protein